MKTGYERTFFALILDTLWCSRLDVSERFPFYWCNWFVLCCSCGATAYITDTQAHTCTDNNNNNNCTVSMSAATRILISLAHTEAVPLGPVHRMTLRARNLINIAAIPCIRNAIVFHSSEVGRSSESWGPIAFRCRTPADSPPPKIGRHKFLIIAGDLS